MLRALFVGEARVQRFGVLRTELEHVPDFDAAIDRQRVPAARADIAGHDRDEIGPDVDGEVTTEHALRTWWSGSFAPVIHATGAPTEGSATTTVTSG